MVVEINLNMEHENAHTSILPSKKSLLRTPSKRKILSSLSNSTPSKKRPLSFGYDIIKTIENVFGKKKIPPQNRYPTIHLHVQVLSITSIIGQIFVEVW